MSFENTWMSTDDEALESLKALEGFKTLEEFKARFPYNVFCVEQQSFNNLYDSIVRSCCGDCCATNNNYIRTGLNANSVNYSVC